MEALKAYLPVLARCALFAKMEPEQVLKALSCLSAQIRKYRQEEVILLAGEPVRNVGILLSGAAQIFKEDLAGNRNILARVEPGELFAEVFACVNVQSLPVTVQAAADTAVLFIDFGRITAMCPSACAHHARLIENMLYLMARKNLSLNDKVACLGHRTIQDKVESFLTLWRDRAGGNVFTIPFTRAEMADYLCVDRSALSAVLSKMQAQGVIRFHKNRFELLSVSE